MSKLVIVESPTKAKTISKFLGKGFTVESSYGHVRDLPKGEMGVDTENDMKVRYVIPTRVRKRVNQLKKLAKEADEVLFATDEDREGEAISWHLAQIFEMKPEDTKRIVFHEITKEAIAEAMKTPRHLNVDLVDAQQARRVLDRLVGYSLSPFLWKKLYKGLSAGRVQSVAVRLIVEREREIEAFKPQEYWSIDAEMLTENAKDPFEASLWSVDGKKLEKFDIPDEKTAKGLMDRLDKATFSVDNVEKKQKKKKPTPPFTTSSLQIAANRKLHFSAKQTMTIAQQLYEGIKIGKEGSVGLITYMRTDSVNLASKFMNEAGNHIKEAYGNEFHEKRAYKSKAKGAQEAHEAIRPSDPKRTPEAMKEYLNANQLKLYDLIWRRAIASQMADALIDTTSANIITDKKDLLFRATGSTVTFQGYLKVYPEKVSESMLPELEQGQDVEAKEIKPSQHHTEPPSRYTEASLVKVLENHGIGRPSTYAPTISTVQTRGYVEKEKKKLSPTEIGMTVNDLLVEHFPNIVDLEFTANMEELLDDVAEGEKDWRPVLKEFYGPFQEQLKKKEDEVQKHVEETDLKCHNCGKPMIIKMGRFGKFLACTGFPECKTTAQIEDKDGDGKPDPVKPLEEKCPECGKPLVHRQGRFGPFIGCSGYPDCKHIKQVKKDTGVKCPTCKKGSIIEKRTKKGKIFYACDQYPDCEQAYWAKPTGDKCPECKELLLDKGKKITCSSKECKYSKEKEEEPDDKE